MSFTDFKEATATNPGSVIRYGSNDLKEVMQILNGKVVSNRRPKILNEWIWLNYFDIKAPLSAPSAPTDTFTNRVYTDPSDSKLKIVKTGGAIVDLEGVTGGGDDIVVGNFDYFLFIDSTDNNIIKAFNGQTGQIDFSHATDFGSVFNSCVTALPSTGGSIGLGSGTFLTTTTPIISKNFLMVMGQGMATVIKLANGVNGGTHVMATPNVDTMTGTDDPNGVNVIHDVTLKDFTLDGNKTNNATGGCGLKKYSYGWSMDNLIIRFAKSHGLVSEWSDTAGVAVAGERGMEDYNSRLNVMRCDGKGIYWRGPHDSHFVNCISFGHGLENWHIQSGTGFSGGSSLVQCHTWSGSTVTPSDSLLIDNSFCNAAAISCEGAHDTGKAALHLTASAKLVGANVWCFASDIGMLIESDFNNIHGYVSGVDSIGCSVQTDHNNLDINIVDMIDTGGFGLVVGAAGNSVSYNRIRARTSKINDTHLSWDNASNADNSLELVSVVDTGETDCTTTANLNQVTNNIKVYSIGPGTHNLTNANPTMIPFTNVANVFTEPQILRKDVSDLLTIHRTTSSAVGTGIAFNLGTGAPGNQYAKIYGFAVTSSPLVGRLEFWLPNTGAAVKKLALLADGSLETQGYTDLTAISTPTDPAAGKARYYVRTIDANNDGLFVKLKVAGSIVEVQLAP